MTLRRAGGREENGAAEICVMKEFPCNETGTEKNKGVAGPWGPLCAVPSRATLRWVRLRRMEEEKEFVFQWLCSFCARDCLTWN